MSKACIIHVNNPISIERHPSLLGYMLTQLDFDEQYVEDTLDAVYDNAKNNSWGVLKSRKSISPNPEPDVENFLGLSGIQVGPRQLAYMKEVQRFYDDHGRRDFSQTGIQ